MLICIHYSFKYLFVAGEHCDFETMDWIRGIIKKPIIDHFWQTESGWPILATSGKIDYSIVVFFN